MNNDDAKAVANMLCFMQSCNQTMAKGLLAIQGFRDGVVAYNLAGQVGIGHSILFQDALRREKLTLAGFSHCDCLECWAVLIDAPTATSKKVQVLLIQTAIATCGRPEVSPERLATLPLSPPPPVEHIADYIRLARQYRTFPDFKCSRMVYDGNQGTRA